jgi:hypothetical protein
MKTRLEWQAELDKIGSQIGAQGLVILDDEPKEIQNRFGGGSIVLNPVEIAIYDLISGAEMFRNYQLVQKGIDWFIANNVEAYSILLD